MEKKCNRKMFDTVVLLVQGGRNLIHGFKRKKEGGSFAQVVKGN